MRKDVEEHIKLMAEDNTSSILANYLDLRPRGADQVAVCPFHDDHSPSLHVSASKKIWKCFACGASGDAISFVMQYEQCNYVEALKTIADILHIYVDDETSVKATEKPHNRFSPPKGITYPPREESAAERTEMGEIPLPYVERSMRYRGRLYDFLFQFVGTADLESLWQYFGVGATRDGAEVFWSFDVNGHCRYGKVMGYKTDGHRDHSEKGITAIHFQIIRDMRAKGLWTVESTPSFSPTLFGAHQLEDYPKHDVAIVESEKSALIATLRFPQLLWCAVGGEHNLNARMIAPCKGRRLFLFPDVDAAEKWKTKAQELKRQGFDVRVCEWWKGIDAGAKADIADIILDEATPLKKFTPTKDGWEIPLSHMADIARAVDPLTQAIGRHPLLSTLISSLGLVEAEERDLQALTPMQARISGYRFPPEWINQKKKWEVA